MLGSLVPADEHGFTLTNDLRAYQFDDFERNSSAKEVKMMLAALNTVLGC